MASMEEKATLAEGAKACELLLGWQADNDKLPEEQRPYTLQNAIVGLTIGKDYWKWKAGDVPRWVESYDEYGLPTREVVMMEEAVWDDPCFETVDVRDFRYPEGAVSLDRAINCQHRLWLSFEELKELERAGYYKNVDSLKESRDFNS